jgi:hypothetical protein
MEKTRTWTRAFIKDCDYNAALGESWSSFVDVKNASMRHRHAKR